MLYAIWYNLYNLKNVKNTHGVVVVFIKLQVAVTLVKATLLHGRFSRFIGVQMIPNRAEPLK